MIKKIALLAISTYLLTGCEVRGRPEIVPIEGYLTTPEGKAEFKKLTSHSLSKRLRMTRDRHKNGYLQAISQSTAVIFTPMKTQDTNSFFIASKNRSNELIVKLKPEKAFYQIDDTEKQTLPLPKGYTRRIKASSTNEKDWGLAIYNVKDPLESYYEPKRIRYYLPFTINDEPYLIDVTFKFSRDRYLHWEVGFAGSP